MNDLRPTRRHCLVMTSPSDVTWFDGACAYIWCSRRGHVRQRFIHGHWLQPPRGLLTSLRLPTGQNPPPLSHPLPRMGRYRIDSSARCTQVRGVRPLRFEDLVTDTLWLIVDDDMGVNALRTLGGPPLLSSGPSSIFPPLPFPTSPLSFPSPLIQLGGWRSAISSPSGSRWNSATKDNLVHLEVKKLSVSGARLLVFFTDRT